jgi:hypothetical protein
MSLSIHKKLIIHSRSIMVPRRGRLLGPGLFEAPALFIALIHPSAWKMNSRKFISTILNIRPYRAAAMRHLAAPMDRMLPQDVVGLDKDSLS